MRKVVVTGIGAVSPLGATFRESWEALKAGVSGLGRITRLYASGLPSAAAGEVKGFDAGAFARPKDIRRLDLFVHYALAAASMAAADAGLAGSAIGGASVVIGSGRGGVGMAEEAMRTRPTAYLMSGTTVGMAASYVAMRLGIKGGTLGISSACASGASAIGEAARLVRHGYCDTALAGGAEAPITPLCIRGYAASGALSRAGASRPFDRRRDGFVLSEGACVLVLEERRSALMRGARIYAEVAGYGTSADAFHETAPDMEGQAAAMRAALKDAGAHPDEVGHVSAHATSTPLGDRVEAGAIRMVFGDRRVAVSAVKSMTGHMLGASGALEAAFAAMGLAEGVVPPTINLDDPEFDLGLSTALRKADAGAALVDSFGFGGSNSVLLLRRAL